jgi:hypothetical protein
MLGTAVYAGLVDKNMWHHVRSWAGVMIAVILVKPVIVIVLGLAGALSSSDNGPDAFSAVVSGLAIILLAIFASFMIYRFVPGFGDDVVSMRNSQKSAGQQNSATAVISSPAALVKQGIKTHSARGGPQEQAQGGGAQPSNPMSGGMAAHSSRGGGGGGGGGAGSNGGGGGSGGGSTPGSSPLSGSPFRTGPGRGQGPGSNNGSTPGGDRP